MLFKNKVGERVQAEIPVFEREVRQPLHIVTTQPPKVVHTLDELPSRQLVCH